MDTAVNVGHFEFSLRKLSIQSCSFILNNSIFFFFKTYKIYGILISEHSLAVCYERIYIISSCINVVLHTLKESKFLRNISIVVSVWRIYVVCLITWKRKKYFTLNANADFLQNKFQIKYIYPFVTVNYRKFEISVNEEITFHTTKHLPDRGRHIDTHLSTIRKNKH